MASDRIAEMTQRECMQLLAANRFGRVAINDRRGPVVLPVNYVLDGDSVLFRSAPGTKVDAGRRGSLASFEVDAVDVRTRTGWSVIARGTLTDVYDHAEIDRAARLPLASYVAGEGSRYLRLLYHQLSGRRIRLPEGTGEDGRRAFDLGHIWRDRDAADLGM